MSKEQKLLTQLREDINSGSVSLENLQERSFFRLLPIRSQCDLLLLLSQNSLRAGEPEIAQEVTLQALELAKNTSGFEIQRDQKIMQAMLWNQLGTIARRTDDLDRAEHFLNTSLRILQRLKYNEGQSSVLSNLGNVAMQRGNYRRAKKLLLMAKKKGLRDPEGLAITHLNLANCYIQLGSLPSALKQLDDIENESNFPLLLRSKVAAMKGNIFGMRETWNLAVPEFKKALDFLDKGSPLRVTLLQNMGVAYDNLGKHQEAIRVLREYLSEGNSKAPERSEILLLLGKIYVRENDSRNAENCFSAAVNLAQSPEIEVAARIALAQRQETHSLVMALDSYRKVNAIIEEHGDLSSKANMDELIAEMEFRLHQFEEGFEDLEKARKGYEAHKEQRKVIGVLFKFASVHLFNKKWQSALDYLRIAENAAEKSRSEELVEVAQVFQDIVNNLERSLTHADFDELKERVAPTELLLQLDRGVGSQ